MISIFCFTFNDKFPLDILHRQYKKYIKEEFEFILFNDADDPQMEKNINTIASYNNIKCVRVPQTIHKIINPSECYATTLNWALHEYAPQNGCEVVMLCHSDVFPICDVSISEILGEYAVASVTEFRLIGNKGVNYLYPALTIVNTKKIDDIKKLNFGLCAGLDTGGRTREFIESYPNLVKFMANHQTPYFIATLDKEPIAEYFKENLQICQSHGLNAGWIADGFFHYIAGSQWNAGENSSFAEGHKKRMDLFLRFFY